MTQFYDVVHDTAYTSGVPEIEEIIDGIANDQPCLTCGASKRHPSGDLQVRLGKTRAKMWSDVIACGDYPCFVVSDRFVSTMRQWDIRLELGGVVRFAEPIENCLSLDNAPQYFWIDGKRHLAGRMDFEASGFVDVRFCPDCGNRTDNIGLTYDRQHTNPPPPFSFEYDEASRFDLFTTDLAPTAFFCTERVLECAREHRLTNLCFSPTDQGVLGKPVRY